MTAGGSAAGEGAGAAGEAAGGGWRSGLAAGLEGDLPVELRRKVFGPRLALIEELADLLALNSDKRGLLGPRELGRLWERHLV
ncbi:MAG: hypothetical protein LBO20_02135, partial [Bifidobacteriaceae bacterium]|nr:hypothetical protein [Bifidobacteriaceae bacterium]